MVWMVFIRTWLMHMIYTGGNKKIHDVYVINLEKMADNIKQLFFSFLVNIRTNF
jgi:hypothetical protein